jgi:hypothetical protein
MHEAHERSPQGHGPIDTSFLALGNRNEASASVGVLRSKSCLATSAFRAAQGTDYFSSTGNLVSHFRSAAF